jgi:hypothetical protein
MKTISISCLISLLLLSCGSSKFYRKTMDKSFNDTIDYNIDEYRGLIFSSLKNELKNSNHIIFHFVPTNIEYSKEFSALVYDVTNNKKYSLTTPYDKPTELKIDLITEFDNNTHKYIITKYLNGEIDYILWLATQTDQSGLIPIHALYDIDLEGVSIRYVYRDFFDYNDPAIPFLETEFGKKAMENWPASRRFVRDNKP